MTERTEDDGAPASHAEIRRRWQEARGEPWRPTAPPWLGHAALVVLLGGGLVAAAASFFGSLLAWYAMFIILGYWLCRCSGLPWWAGAAAALPALFVADHVLSFLVANGGLGMLGRDIALASSGPRLHGRLVWLVPVLLGAAGGAISRTTGR